MAFHDAAVFPTDISYGSRGGPGFRTEVIELGSGEESRVQRWENPRHQYDVRYGIKTRAQAAAITQFFIGRRGALHGFPYKDWNDFTTAQDGYSAPATDDAVLGTGDGVETQFQLRKTYEDAVLPWDRILTKVVESSVVIEVDGTPKTSPTHWSVDSTTGIVTFTPGNEPADTLVVKGGCEFYVPCRFGEEADEALETLARAFDVRELRSIPVVEVLSPGIDQEDFFSGGATAHGDIGGETINITLGAGRAQTFAPSSGATVLLPAASDLEFGGPYFILHNLNGSAGAVTVRNNANTATAISLTAGIAAVFWVLPDSGGNKDWVTIS